MRILEEVSEKMKVNPGLEIIVGHSPVKMTGQIHFSSAIPRY